MTASELMICDWVKWNDQYLQVHKVSEFDAYFGNEATKEIIPNCELEPIPLTKEILELNGLKYDDEFVGYKNEEEYIFVRLPDDYGNAEIEITDGDYFHIVPTLRKYLYVHELQHALRCCGMYELANKFKL